MEKIEKLKQFLNENPGDSFLQHALALEYVKAGEDEQAKKIFEEILARDPGYVGSYYHLAKLLERRSDIQEAIACYQKGMEEAKKAADSHAYNELRSAYEELIY
jgi:Tfp pilus assembly protein PilF